MGKRTHAGQATEIGRRISENVKTLRATRKLSLDELAKLSAITKAHIWEIEQGNAINPTIATCVNLSRALGVSVEYLCGLSTSKPDLHPEAMRIACEIDALLRTSPTNG